MLWYLLKGMNNPKNSFKELSERQNIEIRFMYEQPVRKPEVHYFDAVNERNTMKAYKQLVNDYETGVISISEFREGMEALADKVDIREIG